VHWVVTDKIAGMATYSVHESDKSWTPRVVKKETGACYMKKRFMLFWSVTLCVQHTLH
jgi:hypothetical protein